MNLFIDTNIFLSFYHFTSDDLEELHKLSVLLEQRELKLIVPQQVISEFRRNRQNKINDALKRLREQRLNLQFPQMCKDFEEYTLLKDVQKRYEEHHSSLIKKITDQVWDESLKADDIVKSLFSSSQIIKDEVDSVTKAQLRGNVGNPPGKNGSLGDAINWETLLNHIPEGEDLYFVSDDKDYFSPLDDSSFNYFLLKEWEDKKGSNLVCYRRLFEFFKDHFPDIELASELEKEICIQRLAASANFAQTHSAIARLSRISEFTSTQINKIVEAVISNTQVYWILEDNDVFEFVNSVIDGNEDSINEGNLEKLRELLSEAEAYREENL